MRRRISLVTHYCGNEGGGVTSVARSSMPFISRSHDVELFGIDSPRFLFEFPNNLRWGRVGFDSLLISKLLAWRPDVIHLHGLFTFVSVSAVRAAVLADIPLIVSPHGMLDSWALGNSRMKKKIFFSLFEEKVLSAAAKIHALNSAEEYSISQVIDFKADIRIIPNGVLLPSEACYPRCKFNFKLLFLGRLHPKKGVSELLISLFLLKQRRPEVVLNFEVNIVGWGDDKFVAEMKELAQSCDLTEFVHFRGAAFDEGKANYFATADAFILPSFSEGLPMAVLEAWSYGLPVLMTPECNLPEGFESNAAIRVQTNPESLAKSIAAMLETPRDELHAMGQRGLELVRSKFSWDSVAKQYLDMYEEVLAEHEAKKLSKYKV